MKSSKTLERLQNRGRLEFIANLSEQAKKDSNIIGQFGVGFYSVFMVADEVRIRTKSHKRCGEPAYEWHSDGTGKYFLNPIEKKKSGNGNYRPPERRGKGIYRKLRIQSIIKKIFEFCKLSHYGLRRKGKPDYSYLERTQKEIKRSNTTSFINLSRTRKIPRFSACIPLPRRQSSFPAYCIAHPQIMKPTASKNWNMEFSYTPINSDST